MPNAVPSRLLAWIDDEDGGLALPWAYAGLLALVALAVGGESSGQHWQRTGISLTWNASSTPVLRLP